MLDKLLTKLKLRIAYFLDPITLSCWADSVLWAMGYDGYSILPWKDGTRPFSLKGGVHCLNEGLDPKMGRCYCYKYCMGEQGVINAHKWKSEQDALQS